MGTPSRKFDVKVRMTVEMAEITQGCSSGVLPCASCEWGFGCELYERSNAALSSMTVTKRLWEVREALVKQGLNEDHWYPLARKQWWAEKFYLSNDRAGLKESSVNLTQ